MAASVIPGGGWTVSYIDQQEHVTHEPVVAWAQESPRELVPLMFYQGTGMAGPVEEVLSGDEVTAYILWHPKNGMQGKGAQAINNVMAAWAYLKGVEI